MRAILAGNDDLVMRRPLLVVAVFASALFLAGLGRRDLWGADEPRVVGIASQMARSGDPVVPRLNDRPFLEQPPFYYWIAAPIFVLLGESTYSARLPSALAAIAGVLLTFVLARKMGLSTLIACLSALVLATFAEYWNLSHQCLVDMMLCLWTTAAVLCFLQAVGPSPRRNLWAFGFAISLACALLTKGTVGLAIPLSALAVWLLVKGDFSLHAWRVLVLGSLLSIIPAAVWVHFLCERLGVETVYPALVANNFGRFTGSYPQHAEPFYFYLVKSPPQFFPWILFLPVAVIFHTRQLRQRRSQSPSLFTLLWFVVPFLLLCVSAGKRGIYLLPLYPAAALFIGQALGTLIEGKDPPTAWFTVPAAVLTGVVCITPLVFVGMFIHYRQPWTLWSLTSVAAVCLAGFTWRCLTQNQMERFARMLFLTLLAVYLAVNTTVYPIFNQKESFKPLFDCCRILRAEGMRIGLVYPRERISGAAVLYLGETVPELIQTEDIAAFLNAGEKSAVVAAEESLRSLPDIDVLQRFTIGNDTMVVAAHMPGSGE
ncbi:MAG: glycosyltransferase family 39 protein [Phycisphaerales bacterium]